MTPPRTGLLFAGAPSVPEMVDASLRAEAAGFESVWIAETRMTRDAFVPAAAIAQATDRIRIGTGIVNVYTRNPVVLALSFIGLEEIAPGRIVMGLGTGSPGVLAPQGIPFTRPLTRLKAFCEVIPALIRGEPVTYSGEGVELAGAKVEDLLSARGGPTAARARLPLHLGVTGPRALEYAGQVADGVLMNACLPVEYVVARLELLERGARRAGRSPADVEVSMAVVASPHEDSRTGKDGARRFVALYLSTFPNIARETGVPEAQVEEVRATLAGEGLDAAAALVGDDVVARLAVAGTPEECRARLDAYRSAGVAVPVLAPVEGALEPVLDLLAPAGRSA